MSEEKIEPCEICPIYQIILRIHESEAAQHLHNAEKELQTKEGRDQVGMILSHPLVVDQLRAAG